MQHYINFDLEVSDYGKIGTDEHFEVRIPRGEYAMLPSKAVSVKLPSKRIRSYRRKLIRRELKQDELIDFGTELGNALFPGQVRNAINESIRQLQNGQGLRIRLILDGAGLASLPWEFVCLQPTDTPGRPPGPQDCLALDRRVSLVRYEPKGRRLVNLNPDVDPIRLVALMSNPKSPGFGEIDVGADLQILMEVEAEIPNIHVDPCRHATKGSLTEALAQPAHIFHFSGHGTFEGYNGPNYGSEEGKGAIILAGEDNRAKPLDATALAVTLRGTDIRLATLSACLVGKVDAANDWAGVATALVKAGIPVVIGMQFTIYDKNARFFSKAFYRALAAGKPIDAAVTDGRIEISTERGFGERDWGVPVLYMRDTDGILFPMDPIRTDTNPRILRKAMVDTIRDDKDIDTLCRDMRWKLKGKGMNVPGGIQPAPGQINNRISDLIECLELEDQDRLSRLHVLYEYFEEEESYHKVIRRYEDLVKEDNHMP